MNTFAIVGLVGLVVAVGVNLIAMLVFKKTSAQFFSEQWWSSWFPTYTVWLVFLIVGLASRNKKNDGGGKS
jgi:hypothetical protein